MGSRLCTLALLLTVLGAAPAARADPAWQLIVPDAHSINQDQHASAENLVLAAFQDIPYAAWFESDAALNTGGDSNPVDIWASRYGGFPFESKRWSPLDPAAHAIIRQPGAFVEDLSFAFVGTTPQDTFPYLAWSEGDGSDNPQIRVSQFDGQHWQPVGGQISADPANDRSDQPSIAGIGGVPYVAWIEPNPAPNASNYLIHVKRFGGGTWVDVGGPVNISSTANAFHPALADVGGVPYIAWQENGVRVARFDSGDAQWHQVGSGPVGTPISNTPVSIASDGGTVFVAWTGLNSNLDRRVFVSSFDGTNWQPRGGGKVEIPANEITQDPSLALVHNRMVVAYRAKDGSHFHVHVAELAEDTWQDLGSGVNGIYFSISQDAAPPSLVEADGIPVVGSVEAGGAYVYAYGEPATNTSRPTMSGTPAVGSTLTCDPGTWTGDPTFTFLWDRAPRGTTADNDPAWIPINNAVGSTYQVQADDAGSRVRCRVLASRPGFGTISAVSTSLRADTSAPSNTTPPHIVGIPIAGNQVTCDPGTFEPPGVDLSFRWYTGGQLVSGETGSTLGTSRTPHGPYNDTLLTCEVVASNDVGAGPPVRSPPVHMVSTVPEIITPPHLLAENTPKRIGRGFGCTQGNWERDYREYQYQWFRDGAQIAGATGANYQTTVDDLGRNISCGVISSNPVGPSAVSRSDEILNDLPAGTGGGFMYRAGGRTELDPINFMAISADYLGVIRTLTRSRLGSLVANETKACASDPRVARVQIDPDRVFFAAGDTLTRCRALVQHPERLIVGETGVYWRSNIVRRGVPIPCAAPGEDELFVYPDGSRIERRSCSSLNFALPPVDPVHPPAADLELQAKLRPANPVRVLYDFDGNGTTDVSCPGTAPVARTLLDPGVYNVHAVIVTQDSPQTGIVGNVYLRQFQHPTPADATKPGALRPAQPIICRTGLEPPPDPDLGPCVTDGTIGRVHISGGNLCPISVRAIPLHELRQNFPKNPDGSDSEDYKTLKAIAEKLDLGANQARAARRTALPSDMVPAVTRIGGPVDEATRNLSAAGYNAESAVTSFEGKAGTYAQPYLDQVADETGIKDVQSKLASVPNLKDAKAAFALDQIYLGTGPLQLNGVDVKPNDVLPMLVPSEVSKAIPNPDQAMHFLASNADTALGGLPLEQGKQIAAQLQDAPNAAKAALLDQLNLEELRKKLGDALNIGPFKITGTSADVKLNKDGTATLTAKAELPLLKDPGTGKSLRLDIVLNGDQSGHLKLQGVTLQAPGTLLGPLLLKDLFFHYGDGFQIKGKFLFPPTNEGIEIRNFELHDDGSFKALELAYLAGAGSGIPVVPGIYITKVSGGINPLGPPVTRITGGATISVGPSTGGGCPTAGVDTNLDLTFGGNPDFVGTAQGQIKLVCFKLGTLIFYVDSTGLVKVDGNVGVNAGPITATGELHGKLHLPEWQAEAGATVGLKDLPIVGDVTFSGSLLISSRGAAGCVTIPLIFTKFRGGIAERFPHGIPPLDEISLIANFHAFFGCDLSEYRPLGNARAAAGGSTFTMPRKVGTAVLSIEGAGGAPHVKLHAPGGSVYDFTNAVTPVRLPDAAGQIRESEDRTVVVLKNPPGGTWTAETAFGSKPVARVQISTVLPQPQVTANVGGVGSSRILRYSIRRIRGQQVRFSESAAGELQPIRTINGGGKGIVHFTTGEAQGAKRQIVADVIQDGMPRASFVVARYSAPNPAIGRPRAVRVRRKPNRALVTWKAASLAISYIVSVTDTNGGRIALFPLPRQKRVVVPHVGKKMGLTVRVVGVSRAGRHGPAATVRLKAPVKKKARPRKHK
jgi:hypothetical protein